MQKTNPQIANQIRKLCNIIHLDIDTVYTYEEALKNIKQMEIREKIAQFRDEHVRHIDNVGILIRKLGGTPPDRIKDMKGYLMQGFTTFYSLAGTIGALNSLKFIEEITTKTYETFLQEADFPLETRRILDHNCTHEKQHLEYLKTLITTL